VTATYLQPLTPINSCAHGIVFFKPDREISQIRCVTPTQSSAIPCGRSVHFQHKRRQQGAYIVRSREAKSLVRHKFANIVRVSRLILCFVLCVPLVKQSNGFAIGLAADDSLFGSIVRDYSLLGA